MVPDAYPPRPLMTSHSRSSSPASSGRCPGNHPLVSTSSCIRSLHESCPLAGAALPGPCLRGLVSGPPVDLRERLGGHQPRGLAHHPPPVPGFRRRRPVPAVFPVLARPEDPPPAALWRGQEGLGRLVEVQVAT